MESIGVKKVKETESFKGSTEFFFSNCPKLQPNSIFSMGGKKTPVFFKLLFQVGMAEQ